MASPTPSLTPDQLEVALQKILNGPAGIPPPGTIPNFDNPPNLAVLLDVTVGLTVGLATCAVIIRVYTKYFLLRSMGYDDCKYSDCTHCEIHLADTPQLLQS